MNSTESQAEIQQQAQEIWDGAAAAPDQHPFFVAWGAVPGLKVYQGDLTIDGVGCDGTLLVPMLDAERRISNLAFVGVTGERIYLSKDHIAGNYFALGQRGGSIAIAEGLLRGARFHAENGGAVAIAFNAANVPNVKQIMRERYPDARIVLVARAGSIQDADGEVDDLAGDVDMHTADATGDSATAPGLAGEHATDEHSDAPRAPREPPEGLSQAPAPCRTSEVNELLKPESEEAQLLLKWIQRKKLTEFTRRHVLQCGPNSIRLAPIARAALRQLVAGGWLLTQDNNQYRVAPAALAAFSREPQPA